MLVNRLHSSPATPVSHLKTSARVAHARPAGSSGSFAAVLGTSQPSVSTTSSPAPAAQALSPSLKALFTQGLVASTAAAATTATATTAAATSAADSPASTVPDPHSVPTLASVFGPTPWLTDPQGRDPNGNPFSFNQIYFASADTAAKVAQMVGGKVVSENAILTNGPITQSQPNYMVQMPNGNLINPGLVASFYTHGYPQFYVDQMVAQEAAGGVSA